MDSGIIIAIIGIAVPGVILMIIYNGHVNRRNAVDYAFASIDVQLKRRWDLIPNLVNTVKEYSRHESELFQQITTARQQARKSQNTGSHRFNCESQLSHQLPQLIAISENYPELKADKQFLLLQRNLTETESQISAARRAFNAAVMNYNNGIEMFPSSIIAQLFGFRRRDHFAAMQQERLSVHV